MSILQDSSVNFEQSIYGYSAFTQYAALQLRDRIQAPPAACQTLNEINPRKISFQLRCVEQDTMRLRVLVVNGLTTTFALAKYVVEAFNYYRAMGTNYVAQPSKGTIPRGSHWTIEVPDDHENSKPKAGIIGSKRTVYDIAGKGAPFFHEKKVKVINLFHSRGDTMVYRCSGEHQITVTLDGISNHYKADPRFTPRCVGADEKSLTKHEWTDLNITFLQNVPPEMLLVCGNLTEEEREDAFNNHYKFPLFDNRGKNIAGKRQHISELHRLVALPFRDEGPLEDEEGEDDHSTDCAKEKENHQR